LSIVAIALSISYHHSKEPAVRKCNLPFDMMIVMMHDQKAILAQIARAISATVVAYWL
jgi:hypothetical protein